MYTIVIADGDATYIENLVDKLENENVKVVGKALNGLDMLGLVRKYRPELVIISLLMPKYDGFYVLDALMREKVVNKYLPKIVVISSISYGKMKDRAIDYGIDYYFLRSSDQEKICSILLDDIGSSVKLDELGEQAHSNVLYISRILHDLGVPAHLKGYMYIREAILISQHGTRIYAITRDLYPYLAEKFDTTTSRVERAIRHAITVAWERGNEDKFDLIFNCSYKEKMDKPTNGEFVAVLSQILRRRAYEKYC